MAEKSSKSLKETHNGLKKEGDLDEIKEFSDDVKQAMEETDVEEDSVEEFEEWRPQEGDEEEDIKQKTVRAATKSEKQIERQSDGVKQDVKRASDKMVEAGKKAKEGQTPDEEIKDASKQAMTPLISGAARTVRKLEETIYSNVMLPLN